MPAECTRSGATVDTLLRDAARRLSPVTGTPRLDAELLLAHVLDGHHRPGARARLYAAGAAPVAEDLVARFEALLAQRLSHRPVAQITGFREFWSLPIAVTPAVLTPRPETEFLVERALLRLPATASSGADHRVLDLGTGSAAIPAALAAERPRLDIVAVDVSSEALQVAEANLTRLGATNVRLRMGSWYEPVAGERFHAIVSNPPYLADGEWLQTGPELMHEPRVALAGGPDGLDGLRIIVAGAPAHLHPGGWLLVEHGAVQAAPVTALFATAGFLSIGTHRDLAGLPRITEGRVPPA